MPTDTLLDAIADNVAEVDEIAEDTAREHNAALQALLMSPEGRDPVIWGQAWSALVEPLKLMEIEDWVLLDSVDYAGAPDSLAKPIMWSATFAAAKAQADLVLFRALLPVLDRQADDVNSQAGRVNKGGLKDIAKRGPGKARFTKAREAREARRGRRDADTTEA